VRYSIQLIRFRKTACMLPFVRRQGLLDQARRVAINEHNARWHPVLIGDFQSADEAKVALEQLPDRPLELKPMLREMAPEQQLVPLQSSCFRLEKVAAFRLCLHRSRQRHRNIRPMPTPRPEDAFILDAIDYPETDGEPVAESDFQLDYVIYARESLRQHFKHCQDVYVAGNLLIYYDEGNPKAAVAPDCFVVRGVPNHKRRTYKVWQEGEVPVFCLEITSMSTRSQDLGPKLGTYAFLGIEEYWQYDPTGDYLDPRLQGYRLDGSSYQEIPRPHPFGADYHLTSAVLGLELHLEDGRLRFRDPSTGLFLPDLDESLAENARLEDEKARVLAGKAQAEAEKARAEEQARTEAQRRHDLEQRLAALEARLREFGG
jgi:Uma2 family endonuclease